MNRLKYIVFFWAALLQLSSKAQFFTLPDVNFRNYLQSFHPTVLNGSQQLIIANAKALTAAISCSNLGITSLSGIEYFHSTNMINCSGNPITSLPSLDSLMGLNHLWAIGCQLSALPNVQPLTALQTLDLKNNQLTLLPSISGMASLEYLDCSGNQLTSLPDMSGLVSLKKFYCYNNQITQLPSLSSLISLELLDCSDNLLNTLPSINNLTLLTELTLNHNRLTTLPALTNNTLLQIIKVNNNRLTTLPNLSGYTALTQVSIQNNQLSFAQLLPQTTHPQFVSSFQFIPQDTLLNYPLRLISSDAPGQVYSGIDPGLVGNQYVWFHNGNPISTTTEVVLLDPPVPADTGYYYCRVQQSHPLLTGLTLVVKSAKVVLSPCISSSVYNYTVTSNDCQNGATLEFDEATIPSSYKPFTYSLIPSFAQAESYLFTSATFINVWPGKYDLRIRDQNNCELLLSKYINVPISEDCDHIISPNGDGIDDRFYIENTGKAKVFTKNGSLLKELVIPGFWDGTDKTGNVVPMGYYIVLVNDKTKMGVIVLE